MQQGCCDYGFDPIGVGIAAALAAVLATSAAAAPSAPAALTEEIFLADVPPVLTATRLSQPPAEVPAAVTVIDRRMIEASGALTVPDLLRLVPGFQVGHIDGVTTTVSYHGLSEAYARRMQVLVDGRSVYSPLFGGVYWTDLPLAIEDIDRIEVIRGPNGVTYGANSFAAVLNIITRSPQQDLGGLASYTQGDGDTRRALARYAGGSGDFHYRLTAGYHTDNGFDTTRFPDGQHTRMLAFRGDWRLDARDTLDIQLGYLAGARDQGDLDDPLLDPPHRRDVNSNFQQVRFRRLLGPEEEVSVHFYRDYRRAAETYSVVPLFPSPLTATVSESVTTERTDVELQHTRRLSAAHRLVWGAEARLDRIQSPGFFAVADTDSRLYRLFANDEWRPAPAWTSNLGVMYEHTDLTGGSWSPRLALNHQFAANHAWRAVYSRAWRTPSLIEERGDWRVCLDSAPAVCQQVLRGYPTLAPELIDSYELGYYGTSASRALSADFKVYREEVRDITAIVADGTVIGFRNDGHADTTGWEAQITWRPAAGTQLTLAHAYADQRGRLLLATTPPTYVDTDPSTPTHTTSLLAIQQLPGSLEASAAYYRMSNIRWLGHVDPLDDTGTIRSLDARLAWKFRDNATRGTLALTGRNLLGPYFDYWHNVVLDTRYFLNLSLELR